LQQAFTSVLRVVSNNNRPMALKVLESFQLFKINELRKFRCVAFIRKYKSFQISNATWAILWSKLATPLL